MRDPGGCEVLGGSFGAGEIYVLRSIIEYQVAYPRKGMNLTMRKKGVEVHKLGGMKQCSMKRESPGALSHQSEAE